MSGIQREDEEVEQGGGHELQEERGGSGGPRGSSLRLRRLRWHLQVRASFFTTHVAQFSESPDPVFP